MRFRKIRVQSSFLSFLLAFWGFYCCCFRSMQCTGRAGVPTSGSPTEQEQDRRGNVPSEGGQVMSPAHGPGQDSGICHGRRNCTATMIGISLHSHDLRPLLFGPSGATTLSRTIAAAKICSLLWFFIVALSGCLPMPTTMGHFASYIYSCTVPPHSMGHGHIWSPSHHGRKNFHFSTKSCD